MFLRDARRNTGETEKLAHPHPIHVARPDALELSRVMPALCQTLSHSIDHLVGATEQGNRYFDAECFRCLEVDNEFYFCCLLDWQVGRFLTPENTARINAGEPI